MPLCEYCKEPFVKLRPNRPQWFCSQVCAGADRRRRPPRISVYDRLFSKVNKDGPIPVGRPELGPCWIWMGGCTSGGYGQLRVGGRADGRVVYAHRLSCELTGRPIPSGMTADHLCRQRRCVNPDHIEAVTLRVNVLRGAGPTAENARRVICAQGHPLEFNGRSRECRECRLEVNRRNRAKRVAKCLIHLVTLRIYFLIPRTDAAIRLATSV